MKLLVLIMAHNDSVALNYIQVVKETWGNIKNDNIKIYNFFGGSDKNKIVGDTIFVTSPDLGGGHVGYQKLIDTFDVAYNNLEFDLVLKTTLNMYFRLDLAYKVLSKYELKDFYGSTNDHSLDRNCFSGCSMLLSRDVIKKILDIKHINPPDTRWDDVGFEYLLKLIYPDYISNYKNFKRLDLMEDSLLRLWDPLFKIKYDDLWAFRCKTERNGITNRNLDLEKMKILHKIFNS